MLDGEAARRRPSTAEIMRIGIDEIRHVGS